MMQWMQICPATAQSTGQGGLWSVLLAILFFGALVGIYIFLFLLNKKTPKPEGCENLKADCGGCHDYSCTNNPLHNQKNQED